MTDHPIITPKSLIEVALPLDAINTASAKEKAIRQGHPSSLHLWWARRPLAAARAVIFGQLVHDPEDLWRCQNPGVVPNKQVRGHWTKARVRLFSIIEDLVKWENTTNEQVLDRARQEIRKSWQITCDLNKDHPDASKLFNPEEIPGLHDPFAGGGAIPLEAQRLGLEAVASDLNPIPILINKAMLEIPRRFADKPPVNPQFRNQKSLVDKGWNGVAGLADDVRYYGQLVRSEVEKQIKHLYPPITVTDSDALIRPDLRPYVGQQLRVIAWLWVRTVNSPNPAFNKTQVPLASSFVLSRKKGSEAYVEPSINGDSYEFKVQVGTPNPKARNGTKLSRGANFRCLLSGSPLEPDYIKREASAGRMGARLMAIVAEGQRGRVYLSPEPNHEQCAFQADDEKVRGPIHSPLADDPRNLWCLQYGLSHFDRLFTSRQLVALSAFSDAIKGLPRRIREDADIANWGDCGEAFENGGVGTKAYGEAVATLLTFCLDKLADLNNSLCGWEPIAQCPRHLFGRQAIPMVWDFAEANVLGAASGSWEVILSGFEKAYAKAFPMRTGDRPAVVEQADAQSQSLSKARFVSTDPPYYDNICYADLSDFFYVWLRRTLRDVYPKLLATMTVPKAEELIAAPYRQGGKDAAELFFLEGMRATMENLGKSAHPAAPLTIYYAFKQSETKGDLTNSTGWEVFLESVIQSGLEIHGTWPLRTENASRMVGQGTNALASSVVLACRPRSSSGGTISRREFIRELNAKLPKALDDMTRESEGLPSPVAPVDLSQAIIGPGMAIFSKYQSVLEADGSPMSVRTALQLINRFLAEDDFDADTQFCLHWFDQHGWDADLFGSADVLARAKATSVSGLADAGVIQSGGGKVRLLKWTEYPSDWDPKSDFRTPVWEALHHLIRALKQGGESSAGKLLEGVASKAEAARQLAYRLYTLCERKGWAEDARAYNELITSWSAIESAAPKIEQRELF